MSLKKLKGVVFTWAYGEKENMDRDRKFVEKEIPNLFERMLQAYLGLKRNHGLRYWRFKEFWILEQI
jgi:hypothetical protein